MKKEAWEWNRWDGEEKKTNHYRKNEKREKEGKIKKKKKMLAIHS